MGNLFFDISYTSIEQMIIKTLVFLLVSAILLYGIYFMLAKMVFQKNKFRKEVNLRLVFLWSIFTLLVLFNIYLFFLFYHHGIDSLKWTSLNFYLRIFPQLLLFIGLPVYFLIEYNKLKKIINEKTVY